MGIEKFSAIIKKEFNISKKFSKNNLLVNKLFFDFNSIVHYVSQILLELLNKYLEKKITNSEISEEIFFNFHNIIDDFLNNNDFNNKLSELNNADVFKKISIKNEIGILFKENFDKNKLDDLIIKFVIIFVKDLLDKLDKTELNLIYFCLDGVPSKAKMIEQRKRKFMAEFQKSLFKKSNEYVTKEFIPEGEKIFNKNKLSWSKTNISPGTSFMIKLTNELKKRIFDFKMNNDNINVIISSFNEEMEAEHKISKYIKNECDENDTICVYSPDADVILLSLLNNNCKQTYVLRLDQNAKVNDKYNIKESHMDIIDINKLKEELAKDKKFSIDDIRVFYDIVLIFSVFGNDFIHKLESIDTKQDMDLILDNYFFYRETNSYLLNLTEDKYSLNLENFKNYLLLFLNNEITEKTLITRNYYYENYTFFFHKGKINIKLFNNKLDVENFIKDKKIFTISDDFNNTGTIKQYKNYLKNNNLKENNLNKIKFQLEFFKNDDLLNSSRFLNKIDDIELGNHNNEDEFEQKKINFNRRYFSKNLNNAIKEYLLGIEWIINTYYNQQINNYWYYPYSKSPFISDIVNYIIHDTESYLNSKRKRGYNCETDNECVDVNNICDLDNNKMKKCIYIDPKNYLTPLEQILFTTPMNLNIDEIYNNYSNENLHKIKLIIETLLYDNKLNKLYPNMDIVVNNLFESFKNENLTDEIDCKNCRYLNKCILKVYKLANEVNTNDFVIHVRKQLPKEEQKKLYIEQLGGLNKYYNKYLKYKIKYYNLKKK